MYITIYTYIYIYIYVYICMYVCLYACMHVCMYICKCAHIYLYMAAPEYAHEDRGKQTQQRICMCAHIYLYIAAPEYAREDRGKQTPQRAAPSLPHIPDPQSVTPPPRHSHSHSSPLPSLPLSLPPRHCPFRCFLQACCVSFRTFVLGKQVNRLPRPFIFSRYARTRHVSSPLRQYLYFCTIKASTFVAALTFHLPQICKAVTRSLLNPKP